MKTQILCVIAVLPGIAFSQIKSDLELENIKGKVKCIVEKTCYNPTAENCFHRKTVSCYDRRGYLLSRKIYDDDNLFISDSFVYDASGYKKEWYYHNYESKDIGRNTYEFNKATNEITESDLDTEGTLTHSKVMRFNSSGNITDYKIIEADGNLRGWIEYRYDARGDKVEEIHKGTSDRRLLKYDDRGNMVEWIRYTDDRTYRIRYEYGLFDKNGNWQTLSEISEEFPKKFTRDFIYW